MTFPKENAPSYEALFYFALWLLMFAVLVTLLSALALSESSQLDAPLLAGAWLCSAANALWLLLNLEWLLGKPKS